jgi:hypothetical protein
VLAAAAAGWMQNILHPAFENGPDRWFRNVGKLNLTPWKYPKKNIQVSEHGENLKSRLTKFARLYACNNITLKMAGMLAENVSEQRKNKIHNNY